MTLQPPRKRDGSRACCICPTRRGGRKRGALVAAVATDQNGTLAISFLGGVHVLLFWSKFIYVVEAPMGMGRLHGDYSTCSQKRWTQRKLRTPNPAGRQGKRNTGRSCCHGPDRNSFDIFPWRCSYFVTSVEIILGY